MIFDKKRMILKYTRSDKGVISFDNSKGKNHQITLCLMAASGAYLHVHLANITHIFKNLDFKSLIQKKFLQDLIKIL